MTCDTVALQTELLVFKQVFIENGIHFDDGLKVLKKTPQETLLLFPNNMTMIQLKFSDSGKKFSRYYNFAVSLNNQ